MAENDETENNLIGYDPLAWLDQEPEDDPEIQDSLTETDREELYAATGINSANDALIKADDLSDEQDNNESSDALSPVHLDATLNIQNIVSLHEKLKLVLAANDLIEINASDVASIDTTTFQLLVALKKDAVKLQKTVVFDSPSPRFIESANLLGLLEILNV